MRPNAPSLNFLPPSRILPQVLLVLIAAVVFAAAPPAMAGQNCGVPPLCGSRCPAVPAPKCCTADLPCPNNITAACPNGQLWPDGFQPVAPGQVLPEPRDSTDYRSTSIPGSQSGHELFNALDIEDDLLFVSYNAGIQVWDIASNPEQPVKKAFKEGWLGQFLRFPPFHETDSFIEDIDVLDPSVGTEYFVAVAGETPVGFSLWTYNKATATLAQLYQHTEENSYDVRMTEVGGVVYAFAASHDAGVQVYNVTAAKNLASPCVDEGGPSCGVMLGRVGGGSEINLTKYLDLSQQGSTTYLAASDGEFFGIDLEIWSLHPSNPTAAVQLFDGIDTRVHGVAFFRHSGTDYLGLINEGADRIEIRDVDQCLAGGACNPAISSYGTKPIAGNLNPQRRFLTYSVSEGSPFLYVGSSLTLGKGPGHEQLFDLSQVGVMEDITAGAGSFLEGCFSEPGVDYWGYYQEFNETGYRNVAGFIGMFNDAYFYRAARGVLDIHVRSDFTPSPVFNVQVIDPAPYWFDEPITFSASADHCTGAENWTWLSSNTNATGLGAGTGNAIHDISWDLCGSAHCPDQVINVSAEKEACADDPSAQVNGVNVTLADPRPEVQAINANPPGTTHPLCTVVTFTADVDGKPPFTLDWEVRDSIGTVLDSATGSSFVWDTTTTLTSDIFADGFESGDTTAWGAPVPSPVYTIAVNATNAQDLIGDDGQVEVTLTTGPASLDDPPIVASDLGAGEFQFTAQATNASEYRWEFEDPGNGTAGGCEHYALCEVIDWSTQSQVTHHWTPPNVDDDYGVTVAVRSCSTGVPPTGELILAVEPEEPDPPAVTSFQVNEPSSPSCSCFLGDCICDAGASIRFDATASGDPDHFVFNWDDGTPDTTDTDGTVNHTFTDAGFYDCEVKAVRGVQESPWQGLPGNLQIQ